MAEKEFPSDFDEYAGNDLPYVLIVGFHPVQNKGVRVPIGKIIQGLATTLNPTFTGKVIVPAPNGENQAYQPVPKYLLDDRVPHPNGLTEDKYLRSSDDGTASWVAAINNLNHSLPGGILDARQGKVLSDLITKKYPTPQLGTGYFVDAEVIKTLASLGFSFNNTNIAGSVAVDLSGSSFMYVDFSYSDLGYVNFVQSSFDNVNFTAANLGNANLSGVRLIDVDFTDAYLPNFDINQLFAYYGLYAYQYSSGRIKWTNGIWYTYDGLNGIWIPEGSGSDYYY